MGNLLFAAKGQELPASREELNRQIVHYASWTKGFCISFMVLGLLNSLARSDPTCAIAVVTFQFFFISMFYTFACLYYSHDRSISLPL